MRTAWWAAAISAAAAAFFSACGAERGAVDSSGGDPGSGAPARPVVSGTVSYLTGTALPPDSEVCVTLEDVTSAGAPGDELARQMLSTHGRTIPLAFELGYDPARIDPSRRYAVRAWLVRDGSEPLLGSTTQAPVLTGGAPSRAELVLQQLGDTEAGAAPTGERPALIETYWKVVSIDGLDVSGAPAAQEAHLVLRSADSSLVGSTGVNRMFGSYALAAGGGISLRPAGLTRMAGSEASMAQEQRLLARLREVDGYRLEGGTLVLLAAGRDAIALRAAPAH